MSFNLRVEGTGLIKMKCGSITGRENIVRALSEASVEAIGRCRGTLHTRAIVDTPVRTGTLLANVKGSIDAATSRDHKIRVPLAAYGYMVNAKSTGRNLIKGLNKAGYVIYRNTINKLLKEKGLDARFKPGGNFSTSGRILGELNRWLGKIGGILKILPAIMVG